MFNDYKVMSNFVFSWKYVVRTYQQTKAEALQGRKWVIVDAAGIPVGRLASQVVSILRGKHRPTYTRHLDGGDFVVVTNAAKIKLTGAKGETKKYIWHSEYLGGRKEKAAQEMLEKHPDRVVRLAVRGMLPRGPLGYHLLKKLKVYADENHGHAAQQPAKLDLKFKR